ncbi:MAG TPA: hypothetical protein VGK38_08215, partial [Prolixibacteraceae bacterium]
TSGPSKIGDYGFAPRPYLAAGKESRVKLLLLEEFIVLEWSTSTLLMMLPAEFTFSLSRLS